MAEGLQQGRLRRDAGITPGRRAGDRVPVTSESTAVNHDVQVGLKIVTRIVYLSRVSVYAVLLEPQLGLSAGLRVTSQKTLTDLS